MNKDVIVNKLKPIVEQPKSCGFEAYLLAKTEPRLKKLNLSRNGLHEDLKMDLIDIIQDRFLSKDAIFAREEDLGDNQAKFYVIEQVEAYRPFDINSWKVDDFAEKNLDDFMGFLFCFRYGHQDIWCYQNKRNTTITNHRKTNTLARILRYDNGLLFENQNDNIVSFAHVIDIIILDNNLITSDIGLLERSFDLQTFIQNKARIAAKSVAESNLFSGMDKLNQYLLSDSKSHKPYRKKMMKALDSPVLQMTTIDLYSKLSTLSRWKDKFRCPVDGRIPIESVKEVESMIDLLIERFTVSEVTGQEYDTEVKKKAESI